MEYILDDVCTPGVRIEAGRLVVDADITVNMNGGSKLSSALRPTSFFAKPIEYQLELVAALSLIFLDVYAVARFPGPIAGQLVVLGTGDHTPIQTTTGT